MTDLFTLQVNDSGAWRTVVKGSKEQMQDIEHHAAVIAGIVGKRYKWRIIHSLSQSVIGYCNTPDFTWTPPKQVSGAGE